MAESFKVLAKILNGVSLEEQLNNNPPEYVSEQKIAYECFRYIFNDNSEIIRTGEEGKPGEYKATSSESTWTIWR